MTHTPFIHAKRSRFARSLLTSAILSSLMIGCGGDDDNSQTSKAPTSVAIPFEVTSTGIRPLATDLVPRQTVEGSDGTFAVNADPTNPVITAIGQLDGFSNNASLDIPVPAAIDAASINPQQSVFLVNADTRQLVPITARPLTLAGGGFALRILPSTPLAPKTRHLVVLSDGLRTTDGDALALPALFEQGLTSNTQSAALDTAIQGWVVAGQGLLTQVNSPNNLALAYTFTTGSTTDVLTSVAQSGDLVNAQAIDWIDLAPATAGEIDGAALFAEEGDSLTTVYQGQIQLPQGINEVANTSAALDSIWQNTTGNISAANPLPDVVRTEFAPILLILPTGDYSAAGGQDCSDVTNFTTAVFVHGITNSRISSLRFAQQMAMKGCVATVVIDHPGHGMAPEDGDLVPLLSIDANYATNNGMDSPWATTVAGLNQAGLPTFAGLAERHGNIGTDAEMNRVPFNYASENALGSSGSNFINLINFARSRDNLRQAVWDQMTLLASLKNVNINGLTLNTNDVHMVGHSLGAIVATTTAYLVNSLPKSERLPPVQTLTAANPGTQITRLLQNSPFFRGRIVGGLAANNIAEGSSSFESFMQVFQGVLDSVDAINFISLNNTPTLMFEMVGGGELVDSADFGPLNAVRAAFQGVYPRDHVVPNFDYAGSSSLPYANILDDTAGFNSVVESAISPFAGTTPLAQVGGLSIVTQSNAPTGNRLLVRLQSGTHSTFASGDDPAVFVEMAEQTLSFIQNGALTINNTSIIAP